jgi:hypothetical protein
MSGAARQTAAVDLHMMVEAFDSGGQADAFIDQLRRRDFRSVSTSIEAPRMSGQFQRWAGIGGQIIVKAATAQRSQWAALRRLAGRIRGGGTSDDDVADAAAPESQRRLQAVPPAATAPSPAPSATGEPPSGPLAALAQQSKRGTRRARPTPELAPAPPAFDGNGGADPFEPALAELRRRRGEHETALLECDTAIRYLERFQREDART